MKYHDDDTGTTLTINRNTDLWFANQDQADIPQVTKNAITDYRNGVISLDDLSCITGKLYFDLIKDPNHLPELSSILEISSDLAYSERIGKNFTRDLKLVLDYIK